MDVLYHQCLDVRRLVEHPHCGPEPLPTLRTIASRTGVHRIATRSVVTEKSSHVGVVVKNLRSRIGRTRVRPGQAPQESANGDSWDARRHSAIMWVVVVGKDMDASSLPFLFRLVGLSSFPGVRARVHKGERRLCVFCSAVRAFVKCCRFAVVPVQWRRAHPGTAHHSQCNARLADWPATSTSVTNGYCSHYTISLTCWTMAL